jgi:membrane protease subunit HflC
MNSKGASKTAMKRLITFSLIGIAIVAVVFGTQGLYTIDETNHGVVLQFQEIQRVDSSPGLYFKTPFIQQVTYLDKRLLTSDTRPQEYLTSDEKRVVVDQVTRWFISDPTTFYTALRTESVAKDRMDTLILAELRAQIAGQPYDTMISSERDDIMQSVRQAVQIRVSEAALGIQVVDVRAKRADLPTEVEENVFARMRSARQVEADRHRAQGQQAANEITAETDRLVTVMAACADRVREEVEGAGDAAAIAIFAQALTQDREFYTFLRRLEAYSGAFSANDKLILSTSSDFFSLLTGDGVSLPLSTDALQTLDIPVKALTAEVLTPITAEEVDTLILQCIPEEAN